MLKAALSYIKNGVNVLTTDASKTSIPKWTEFQSRMVTPEEIENQLQNPKAKGIAIICGTVSGGLEVIDVDLKQDIEGNLWEKLKEKLKEANLFDLFKIAKTRNNGYHLLYRCEVIEGNQVLAARPKTEEEQKNHRAKKGIALIETRGEGGYIVAAPSPGYEWISGRLTVFNIQQRDLLFEICRSFNTFVEAPKQSRETKVETTEFGVSPFDDFNKRGSVPDLLVKHGWTIVWQNDQKVTFKRPGKSDSKSSGDYNFAKNWFSVFTTNSDFEPNKAYLPYAVYAVLECGGNFSEASKKLSAEGYGKKKQKVPDKLKRDIWEMRSEGAEDAKVIQMIHKIHEKPLEEAQEIVESEGPYISEFWDVNPVSKKISIDLYKLKKFLGKNGFYLYKYDKSSTIAKKIRIDCGFIEEVDSPDIKQFIMEYVETQLPSSFDGITADDLMNAIMKGESQYFSEGKLDFLDKTTPDFLKSDREIAYFPFNNGVIVIHKDQIELKSYTELGKNIWKSQVKDFDIVVDQDFDLSKSEYFTFLQKISGDDQIRIDYCLTLIGYLLHAYKDPAKPYAVILAEETESNEDGGGTGKGIFVKALSEMLRTIKVDGKNFKIDKNFALQRVNIDTQLISIEDCNRNLDFESFNSQITEGSAIEKKNKDELFIDYRDSPKFVFSTNYMLNLKGNHGKRRSKVFEFSSYFGPDKTPVDHFGHLLFTEWERDEWIRFYNLMFSCVSAYLQRGIAKMTQTYKLKRKTVRTAYGDEFLEWFIDFVDPANIGKAVMQMTAYNSFLSDNGFSSKDYSVKRFKSGLLMASKLLDIEIKFEKKFAGKEITIEKTNAELFSFSGKNPATDLAEEEIEQESEALPF